MSHESVQGRAIFIDAVENIPPERWGEYLDEACGADKTLREKVQRLLDAHRAIGSFMDKPAAAPVATIDQPIAEKPGTQIGPYKLLQQLGEGGMGIVYIAEQSEPIERRVALKIIKPGMDSRQVVARFEAERQALAMMDHPSIARIIDAGTTELGRPFFVMELVRGIPINEFCDQQRFTVRQRLELFVTACQAVQHAHQKGVIHRDLKPTNVLVTVLDMVAVPKIIDFGIAKAFGAQLTEHTQVTGFSQFVGTPLYMSPEQAEMNQLGVDTRSDVYSLGVILYELLTGATPFDKETFKTSNIDELRRILRDEEPPHPSSRISTLDARALSTVSERRSTDPRRITTTVRGELDWIVMKALEKERNRRYESASAFAADVQHYLNDEAVQAYPPSMAYRLQKFARRKKTALATSLLVAAILIFGTAVSTWQAVRATLAEAKGDRQRTLAVASDLEAQRQATEAVRQRDLARQQEAHVRAREKTLRHYLYASDMKLAWHAWDFASHTNDVVHVRHLLARHEPKSDQEDLRSFAWYYLKGMCGQSARSTLHGHEGKAYHLAISLDGKTIASASQDGTAKLWDLATAQLRHTLLGHTGEVNCVAFAPDGKTLATASDDRSVKFWEVADGQAKSTPTLIGMSMPVHRVEFSSNGKLLVTGEISETWDALVATLWDLPSGRQQRKLDGHFPLALSPDGHTLATTNWDKHVRIWDVACGQERHVLRGHTGTVLTAMFSLDGTLLATGSHDFTVKIWDPRTGLEKTTFVPRQRYSVQSVAWSPDNKLLAAGYESGVAQLWELSSGRPQAVFREHDARVRAVRFTPDGASLACASDDGTIKLCDVSAAYPVRSPPDQPAPVNSISFSPDSELLATSIGQNKGQLWHVPMGNVQEFAWNHSDQGVRCVAFSPTGRVLAIGSSETIYLVDPITGNQRLAIPCPEVIIRSLIFSPNGGMLVGNFEDGAIQVWDTRTGKGLHALKSATHYLGSHCIAISPDGKTLAFQIETSVVQRLDLATGRLRELQTGHNREAICLAYSPDGQTLATGAFDRRIKLWDTGTDQETANLSGHQGVVICLAFSPDSKTLASGSDLGELKIWDVTTAQELFNLDGHAAAITCIAFSPDGKTLATAGSREDGQRGQIRFWRTARETTK